MSAETRKRAEDKLGTFVAKIGYPDKWKDYSALEVKRDDIIGNVHRAAVWDWNRQLARLDQPVDRDEWFMSVTEINAYYNPLNNEIVFPAAILQPPFFDPAADDAVNYGGIGAVIGHEIGHGFDDQGRKFAPDGSLTDWWTKVDADAFGAKTKMLVDQFSSFDALPGLKVNGATSLGENIGDLGGLNMAYEAYHNSLQGKPAPELGGLSGDQRFFLSWAQVWRTKIRDEALRAQVLSDPHAPPYFRVNGAVRNMDEWYASLQREAGRQTVPAAGAASENLVSMNCAWLVAILGIATLSGCSKPPPEPPPAPPPLSKQGLSLSFWKSAMPDLHDRLLLAHALAKGDTEAMVLVATEIGKTAAVAEAIAALGGDLQARFDDVGYLRVRLALDRFSDVGALPDVLMAHLDGGGAHGLYANDRDLVRYPLSDAAASPGSTHALPALDTHATDTLLGADIDSPATTLAAEIESLLQAAANTDNSVLARDDDGGRFPSGGSDLFALWPIAPLKFMASRCCSLLALSLVSKA